MKNIRNLFRLLLKNPDDLMLREDILGILDCASAQVDCSYYYRLYKKIVG
ncbi:MAG: hypothetical protein ACOCRV_02615 [bacterium]